ncbi:LuxR C-terminal-related transcriptional regulator [Cupriavidus basilensis]|uniref:LuxR C-terminal-related transcriptional regulator n=1 Tax=Cupriavidus basilensis TaxID=68895 RepID=UPI0039F6B701
MGVAVKRVALVEKARFFDADLLQRIPLHIGQSGAIPATVWPGVETQNTPTTPSTPARQGLTERQQDVLTLVLEGLPNKLIARRLGLTINTVKEHVSAILQRLGARTRTQLLSGMKPFRAHEVHGGDAANSAAHDQPAGAAPSSPPIQPKDLGLTSRQGTVLLHLLDGLSNKAIALRLGLTENTVKEHVSAILDRLGARTRMQLISQMRHFAPPTVSDPDSDCQQAR